MMIFNLFMLRMTPLLCLKFCKKRSRIKIAILFFLICYGGLFVTAIWKLFLQKHWKGMFYLPLSVFPQWLFYGFAVWMILRCVLHAWSERVWKRIYKVSVVVTIFGVLTEFYWNPWFLEKILKFF